MINSTETVIKIRNLHKNYEEISAVKGISLEIKKSEIFGIIGPDGAGKSSIFNIISGVMPSSSGDVSIVNDNYKDAKKNIGYITQQFSFYNDLTVDENITYNAGIRNIPRKIFKERKDKYLQMMGLEKFTSRLAMNLSGGMKQKLALCCVLVFQPEILLLDEPTTGVDPISRREFWDVLSSLASEDITIVIATPYLDEAERCNRIALIYDGQIQQIDTPENIKKSVNLKRLEIYTKHTEITENILLNAMSEKNSKIKDIQTFGSRLDALVINAEEVKQEIISLLNANKLELDKIIISDITMENVFVHNLREKGVIENFITFPYLKKSLNKFIIKNKNIEKIAIQASGLNKFFGSFQAVKNFNLDVNYGEIYGLLGANGAGKTTVMKILCGLSGASSGEVYLAGEKENLKSSYFRQKIGYMSQKFTLYNDLTVLENLKFYCGIYNVPEEVQKDRIKWILETSGLSGQENMLTGKLPGGWKQRVAFGASVIHEPEILFLDEPTSGVDPIARRQFWKSIEDFALHNTAIIVTTHYLEEADHCNRISFMSAGEIIAEGSPDSIKSSQTGTLIEFTVDFPQKANFVLKTILEQWKVSIFGEKLHVVLDNPEIEIPKIYSFLKENQINVFSYNKIPFSLEDAFISIIKRSDNGR